MRRTGMPDLPLRGRALRWLYRPDDEAHTLAKTMRALGLEAELMYGGPASLGTALPRLAEPARRAHGG